jgi:hypothetical protein
MDQNEPVDSRRSLLAFLEAHWREFTLREAHSLTLDAVDVPARPASIVKETLTYS